SLLHATSGADGEPRFGMFGPVRELAWERLRATEQLARTRDRHLAHYAGSYDEAAQPLGAEALARIERDADNLLAAAEHAFTAEAGDAGLGLRALLALEPALRARGTLANFRALLELALDRVAPGARDGAQARPTARLAARLRQLRARLDAPVAAPRAQRELEACLAQARADGDERFEGAVWLDLGVAHHLERNLAAARRAYETALEL